MSVVGYLVPGLCVFSLNLKVYFQLKRRSSNFQPRLSMDQLGPSEVPFKDGRTRTSSCRLNDIRIHGSSASGFQHRKAARFLTFLLIVFVLCWSPFYIYHCYTFVTSWGNYSVVVDNVVSLILWSNSAINPFLYAFTNVFFKENFMHFLRCKWSDLQWEFHAFPKLQISWFSRRISCISKSANEAIYKGNFMHFLRCK